MSVIFHDSAGGISRKTHSKTCTSLEKMIGASSHEKGEKREHDAKTRKREYDEQNQDMGKDQDDE